MEEIDVVVVGAGPAGAACAGFLVQLGYDVLLLDQSRFPRDKVCGEGFSPETWAALGRLGVEADVRGLKPQPLRGMRLRSPDGVSFCGRYHEREGLAVRRYLFDDTLLRAARRMGANVDLGARVVGTLTRGGRVEGVRVQRGPDRVAEPVRARCVIAADGRGSVVARQHGLLRDSRALRKFAVRGHWERMDGLSDLGEMHVGGGGYCGIAPLSPIAANVAFVLDVREMPAARGRLEAFYRDTLRRWPEIHERLAGATLTEAPRAAGPLAVEARRVSGDGLVLVGDAAGFFDPFTGEGVTLALRSAEMAAEAVDGWLRRSDRLTLYDERRRAATAEKFRFNRLLQKIVGRPALANAVARRLSRRPDVADTLVGVAGDFVPAAAAFRLSLLYDLLRA